MWAACGEGRRYATGISLPAYTGNSQGVGKVMPTILYHYTDSAGYSEIIGKPVMRNGEQYAKILSSTSAVSGDAHYGNGWYFTDLPPYIMANENNGHHLAERSR